MSFDNYTDYIKEDMWNEPTFQSTYAHSQHDSLYPHTPALNLDFELLCLLAQDEIQAAEQQIGNGRDQTRWAWNGWEWYEVAGELENRTLGLFEALQPKIKNETLSIQDPTFYHQPTKPSSWSISHNGALPGNQSSLPGSPAKRATAHRAPPHPSGAKRAQSERKKPSSRLDSQVLRTLLKKWGFVRDENTGRFMCPTCEDKKFSRPTDAHRHWTASRSHAPAGGLYCKVCGEFFRRKDSLARHGPHCGERRKRLHI